MDINSYLLLFRYFIRYCSTDVYTITLFYIIYTKSSVVIICGSNVLETYPLGHNYMSNSIRRFMKIHGYNIRIYVYGSINGVLEYILLDIHSLMYRHQELNVFYGDEHHLYECFSSTAASFIL